MLVFFIFHQPHVHKYSFLRPELTAWLNRAEAVHCAFLLRHLSLESPCYTSSYSHREEKVTATGRETETKVKTQLRLSRDRTRVRWKSRAICTYTYERISRTRTSILFSGGRFRMQPKKKSITPKALGSLVLCNVHELAETAETAERCVAGEWRPFWGL